MWGKLHNEKFVVCGFTRYCQDDDLEEDKMSRKLEVLTKFKWQNLKSSLKKG